MFVVASVCAFVVMDRQKLCNEIELLSDTNMELRESNRMLRLNVALERLAKQDVEIQA